MPDAIDLNKLQKFVEAAISNSRHPVYQAGWQKSNILQHYATNVSMLGAVKPADWFAQYPAWTAALAEAMAYCEAEQLKEAAELSAEEKLRADVDSLQASIAALNVKLAGLTPAAAVAAPVADAPPAAAVA